jgi:peptidoglycan/xylan/chitin deacetylase (PgdA/CDA1 family)
MNREAKALDASMADQDLYGYGPNPPHAKWPNGARVAVSLVLNIEEGSEFAISKGDTRNERVYDMTQEPLDIPDPAMESHFAYGARAGYWRVLRVLDKYGVTCTLNLCGQALEKTPWVGEDGLKRGFEIGCHGYRWDTPAGKNEDEERSWIQQSVESIRRVTGVRPVGWHSRAPYTLATRRLLIEEGGFIYDSDLYDDDLPRILTVGDRRHVVVPYSLDTNDMRCQRPESPFVRAKDFSDYVNDGFDWLWEEGETSPKMMTIGLHTRIIGRPARINGLEAVLRHMTDKGKVWFATREQIARHWLQLSKG